MVKVTENWRSFRVVLLASSSSSLPPLPELETQKIREGRADDRKREWGLGIGEKEEMKGEAREEKAMEMLGSMEVHH